MVLLAVYAGAARWLLSGPRLRTAINTNPEGFLLDYDAATSVWPGRVAIRNLRIRGSDVNAEWIVEVADAKIEYSVPALLSRTFRCLHLRGSGLTFRVRNKLDARAADASIASLLPPIRGFPDPPIRPAAAPPPPNGKRHPWLVDVRSIWLDHFDEVWFDAFRFRGNARLRGQFQLRPGVFARIGPATIDVDGGQVRIGKAAAGVAVSGVIAAAFAPFDVPDVEGSQVWEKVSGTVRLDGRFERLDAFEHLVAKSGKTRLEDGTGTLALEAAIQDGVAKGRLRVDVKDGTVRLDTLALQGDAALDGRIPRWPLATGPLEISGTRLVLTDVRRPGSQTPRRWWGTFTAPAGALGTTSRVSLEARCRDARPLLAVLGTNLPDWTRGLVALDDLSASATVSAGPSQLRVRDLNATGGGFHIQGDYLRSGPRLQGAFLIESGVLSLGVELDPRGTHLRLVGAKPWFEQARAVGTSAPSPEPPRAGP